MVASEPVPAVVGTAIKSGSGRRTFKSPPSWADGLIGADDAGCGDLCRVDGRAAAENEEAVAAVGAVLRGELLNGGDARVGLNAGKDGWANAAPLERGAQGEEALVRALAAAGDDEGARGALARKDVGELQQAARAARGQWACATAGAARRGRSRAGRHGRGESGAAWADLAFVGDGSIIKGADRMVNPLRFKFVLRRCCLKPVRWSR